MNLWQQTVSTFFTLLVATSGWRPFTIEMQNLTYELLHPNVVDVNITMKNRTHLDVHINFGRDIPQAFIDLTVLHDAGDDKFDLVYMNKTVDICQFLTNRKSNIFFDIVYKVMLEYAATLPDRCPIRKKKYQLINTFVDPEKFPSFMPDHKGKISILSWWKPKGVKIALMKMNFKLVFQRTYRANG
ncbi:uncharacterized protein LOC119080157 [Bradysia coprophila]|uniref:uncharacterized protein LOC119080157 n=1 Tax=Bradysia coprophila TaxID=38358 RepID=UPI00187DD176|nr:uncharacterized protein LOC119080157 [Bradysia coprophila]